MIAIRLPLPSHQLLDPEAAGWHQVEEHTLRLEPTPLASQPSDYIRQSWRNRPYGLVTSLTAAAVHNGRDLFFRLRWEDPTRDDRIADTDQFTDAAAVLFAVRGDAPLLTMGSPDQPVDAWYWRPDLEHPINVTATGIGTTVRRENQLLKAAASYAAAGWWVVISRPLVVREEVLVQLRPGWSRRVAFAVWQGSNRERAGIKAATPEWEPLEIER